jgi:hypothetical protein
LSLDILSSYRFKNLEYLIRPVQAIARLPGHLSQNTKFFQPFHIPLRRPVGHIQGSLKLADVQYWALEEHIQGLLQTHRCLLRAQSLPAGQTQSPQLLAAGDGIQRLAADCL